MRRRTTNRRENHQLSPFGLFLRGHLDKRGQYQAHVATACGVKIACVSNWMSGYSRPELDSVKKLAAFLNVSTDEIMKRL